MKEKILLIFTLIMLTDVGLTILIYGNRIAKIIALIGLALLAAWVIFHALNYWTYVKNKKMENKMEKAIIEMEYGITEAAVRLGMKARTVREWIRNGKIKAHKNTSGKWVIMENEIERIIEEKV